MEDSDLFLNFSSKVKAIMLTSPQSLPKAWSKNISQIGREFELTPLTLLAG
jgi:hypothetical protein